MSINKISKYIKSTNGYFSQPVLWLNGDSFFAARYNPLTFPSYCSSSTYNSISLGDLSGCNNDASMTYNTYYNGPEAFPLVVSPLISHKYALQLSNSGIVSSVGMILLSNYSNFKSLTYTNGLTVSFWIMPKNTTDTVRPIFEFSQGYDLNGISIVLTGSNIQYSTSTTGTNIDWRSVININHWNHIILRHNYNQTVNLWVNGNLMTEINNTIAKPVAHIRQYLYIGRNYCTSSGGTQYYYGLIDDFMYWNLALTNDEITNLINYTKYTMGIDMNSKSNSHILFLP